MADVYNANAVLLIGNDVTQQNPLVAWQIRTGVRHHDQKLYVINGVPSNIHRKAAIVAEVPKGAEAQAVRWLATEKGEFDAKTTESLVQLKAALEAASDVVVIFGADIHGAAIRDLVSLSARFGGKTKFMALGDYSNSRGAADMGVLPDRLPGYAPLADRAERARFGKIWGGEISAKPGLTARGMMEAAVAGKLKALYVVGANPVKTFAVAQPDKLAGLELLVVHDMFLTETAQRADVVLPAASTYEKDGTMTNTAGEVQADASRDRRARSAQRFRFAPHPFAPTWNARAWLADQAAHRRKLRSTKFASTWPATIFRMRACSAAARNSRLLRAKLPKLLTTCLPARSFHLTIICLQAAPWVVTVPGSLRRTRQKTHRGVHHQPAPNPGGIANQDCRPAVHRNDGAGLSDLV